MKELEKDRIMEDLRIKIHSIPNCSKCVQIKSILKSNDIKFSEVCDYNETILIAEKHNILSAPIVRIDGIYYDYNSSIVVIREHIKKQNK